MTTITLIYQGALPTKANAREKQAIRAALHPQLHSFMAERSRQTSHWLGETAAQSRLEYDTRVVDGHRFVTLIKPPFSNGAEMELLILSGGTDQSPVRDLGDIDNRLKTLLDALRAPGRPEELRDYEPPAGGEPLHCLLDDDRLVTRLSIDTGRWLGESDSRRATVLISVRF